MVAEAHAPTDASQVLGVVGDGVSATQLEQLDAVLQRAEELVRLLHRRTVATPDVPALGQRSQRLERRGAAQLGIGPAVHELQQLHGELDVAQATGTELELTVALVAKGCCR